MNITLENNKDVYFVTARQAIEWIKLMPTLERKHLNLTKFIDEQLFNADGNEFETNKRARFDGKCEFLKQSIPDFDISDLGPDFILDDTYGIKQKANQAPNLNATVLTD